MEATLVLYCCHEGHLHAALCLEGGDTADDQVVGAADDWPDLKTMCRDELGRFAPCGGAGTVPHDQPRTPGQKVAHFLDNYEEGRNAQRTVAAAHVKQAEGNRQSREAREQAGALLDRYRHLMRTAGQAEADAYREKVRPDVEALHAKARTLEEQGRATMQAAVTEAFAAPNPAGVSHDSGKDHPADSTSGKSLNEGVAWLKGKVDVAVFNGDVVVKAGTVPPHMRERDYYDAGVVHLSKNTNAGTVVHEIGHYLNDRPEAKLMARAFWQHRFGGEEPVTMTSICRGCGYGRGEKGYKDHMDVIFDKAHAYYAGKKYRDGQTELISMGVEKLFRDPGTMAVHDPQYFKFVHAVLHGKRLP
jgi:hypothetical protein